jgi:hypothetical protein
MATRRLELGMPGGTVLRLTVDEALAADVPSRLLSGEEPWSTIVAEEGTFWVQRSEVLYVRVPPGEVPGRVGFRDS